MKIITGFAKNIQELLAKGIIDEEVAIIMQQQLDIENSYLEEDEHDEYYYGWEDEDILEEQDSIKYNIEDDFYAVHDDI